MNKAIVLSLIVLSQFFGTSLWFCSNAVLPKIAEIHHLTNSNLLTYLTTATQLGFIIGSLCYALLNVADRYDANKVFTISVMLGALANVSILLPNLSFLQVFLTRFLTGVFLAGVYPVGMKIAAYFFPKTVSNALGILVASLVLGTAFPYFMASFNVRLNAYIVILTSSTLAVVGGFLMVFLNTPPKKNIQKINMSILPALWKKIDFKKACLAYFGHMWELYTFWTFVPLLVLNYQNTHRIVLNTSFWSFLIIGSGALGCVIAGKLATKNSTEKIAKLALFISMACCLFSPLCMFLPKILFLVYLLIWGMSVVADSPLLSTMINKTSIQNYNGTALTLSTSIGFLITIISITAFNYLQVYLTIQYVFVILAIGPVLGVWSLKKKS